jgi:hypothetical protein
MLITTSQDFQHFLRFYESKYHAKLKELPFLFALPILCVLLIILTVPFFIDVRTHHAGSPLSNTATLMAFECGECAEKSPYADKCFSTTYHKHL